MLLLTWGPPRFLVAPCQPRNQHASFFVESIGQDTREALVYSGSTIDAVEVHLQERHIILLQGGTMVDATLIHAAPSTKNRAKTRDPEIHQTTNGNQWSLEEKSGTKVAIGADVNSGVVRTVGMTAANTADVTVIGELLREDDTAVFGDAACQSTALERAPAAM